MSVRKLINIF